MIPSLLMSTHVCTIYLKQSDGTFARQVAKCHWEDTQGVNFNRAGVSGVDRALVLLPIESADLAGWGTKSVGYILRGEVTDAVTDTASLNAFIKSRDPFTITSVAREDRSIAIGDHWEVGGK